MTDQSLTVRHDDIINHSRQNSSGSEITRHDNTTTVTSTGATSGGDPAGEIDSHRSHLEVNTNGGASSSSSSNTTPLRPKSKSSREVSSLSSSVEVGTASRLNIQSKDYENYLFHNSLNIT